MMCQNNNTYLIRHVAHIAYSEGIRVHLELLVVQPAQSSVCASDVVHVFHRCVQLLQHHFAVGCYFGVIQNSSGIEDISKPTEIPLGPGSLGSNFTHINLSPQGSDGGALSICPIDHGDGVKVLSDKSSFLITSLLI
uniref:Uncharacterized protein n=1 Tax=Seriola lalandi dorsalis TaxID=1841481 RepID=A0A3B4XCU7_SERLL